MMKYLAAIGMDGDARRRLKFEKLMRNTSGKPDKMERVDREVQCYKRCGEGFGVFTKGAAGGRPNVWGVYGLSGAPFAIEAPELREVNGGAHVRCLEGQCGNALEFRLTNELTGRRLMQRRTAKTADVALMALFGKVLLPVYQDEETLETRAAQEKEKQDLIRRADMGDANASSALREDAKRQAQIAWQRMRTEDVFSIFESYNMAMSGQSAVYSVLAAIEGVREIPNRYSGARIVKLNLNAGGTHMAAYINSRSLLGAPTVGMRFVGTGMMQGFLG